MSEIADALRADAEAAREEIRAAGLVCPSCRKNAADIYGSHAYEDLGDAGIPQAFMSPDGGTLKCTEGEPVTLSAADWDQFVSVSNISLLDEFTRREDEAMKAIIGNGPAHFTGLLDVLRDDD